MTPQRIPREESATRGRSSSGAAGRPRDSRLDTAILDAVRELILEQGYIGLSLAAVADRAGTTTAAIYRRWSGKPELVHEAVFPTEVYTAPLVTGDRYRDIGAVVEGAREILSRPEVRIALPGLIADIVGNPGLHARMFDRLAGSLTVVQDVDGIAHRDLPGLMEAIVGAAMFRVIARPGAELDDQWAASLTDMLANGWRPAEFDGIAGH